MPGLVRAAVSVGTLPFSLSTKFSESHAVQVSMNEYHDGSSQRTSLVTSGRRTWKQSKRLTVLQLGLLRDFFEANAQNAFYFYSPFETVPPFSQSPSGTDGRYLVRFASDWEQTNGMVRSDTGIELIELAGGDELDATAPVTNAAVPGNATITVVSAHIPNADFTPFPGAEISLQPVSLFQPADMIQSSAAWSQRTDARTISYQAWTGLVVIALDHFGLGNLGATLSPPDEVRVYNVYATVTYGDGTIAVLRPTTATPVVNSPGNVTNPTGATDSDPTSFASITRTSYPTNSLPNGLILSSFR
jgi:hypothetical protein